MLEITSSLSLFTMLLLPRVLTEFQSPDLSTVLLHYFLLLLALFFFFFLFVCSNGCLLAADPMQCLAYGPGLEGGWTSEPAVFTIETRNSKGDKLKTGGQPIDVDVSDPRGTEVTVHIVDNR